MSVYYTQPIIPIQKVQDNNFQNNGQNYNGQNYNGPSSTW